MRVRTHSVIDPRVGFESGAFLSQSNIFRGGQSTPDDSTDIGPLEGRLVSLAGPMVSLGGPPTD